MLRPARWLAALLGRAEVIGQPGHAQLVAVISREIGRRMILDHAMGHMDESERLGVLGLFAAVDALVQINKPSSS